MLGNGVSFDDDGWILQEDLLHGLDHSDTDTLFVTSNGYVGVRGTVDGRPPLPRSGTYLNGFFEARPYAHPEGAFGLPTTYQTMVPVTDATALGITVDGTVLEMGSGERVEHRRRLDLRTGCLHQSLRWRSPEGGLVEVRSRRLASLRTAGLVCVAVEVEPLDGPATVDLVPQLRGETGQQTYPSEPEALSAHWGRFLLPRHAFAEGDRMGLVHVTGCSELAVACVAATEVTGGDEGSDPGAADPSGPTGSEAGEDHTSTSHRVAARPGAPARVVMWVGYAHGPAADADQVLDGAQRTVDDGRARGFDELLDEQRAVLDRFWEAADVELAGAPHVEAAVRFSMFHTFQATAVNEGRGCPAKGLTGPGYQGHQMWDQEVYVVHALSYLAPDLARSTLLTRSRMLDKARSRASCLGHQGAQYPWRTIDGDETSAFFPAGTAQYHVNADIAWAFAHHVDCTGDHGFLRDVAAELLVETARLWLSVGHLGYDGHFRIESVTGPDEYTGLVDNNLYTNVLAATNLQRAAAAVEHLRTTDPDGSARLVERTGVDAAETSAWRNAALAVYVPYDDSLAIHAQDDRFLRKRRWDLEATPPDRLPLQDHHHLVDLYRRQVLKQADLVLAMFLEGHRFPADQRRRNFDYYDAITTHDSSLSACIHAVVAADVGHLDRAWDYTRQAALMDLEDRHGTVADGLHIASAAGSWLALACGFGGLRVIDGDVFLDPRPVPGVDRLRFRFRYRGRLVQVVVERDGATYELVEGEAVEVHHGERPVSLQPGQPTSVEHSPAALSDR